MSKLDYLLGKRTDPAKAKALAVARMIQARYDAAQTTNDNKRHWSAADGLSANAANDPGTRRTLRNRARYEVANNSYARGIVRRLVKSAIGTGPRIQLLTATPEANRRIETAFREWAKAIGLARKLRTIARSRIVDGEAFALLINNRGLRTPVQLDVCPIEADRVSTPDLYYPTPNAIDGIQFDAWGNPTEYHVMKSHPGDSVSLAGWTLDYDRYPASSVIHWFDAERPEQRRGIPEILTALPLFAQLRRYTLATLTAAETAADFAAFLKSPAPADGEDQVEGTPFDTLEIERGMLMQLPADHDVTQLDPKQPTTTYKEFKGEILNEAANAVDMPYNIAACNSSGYNYASGRLDHQTYHSAIGIDQNDCNEVVLDRIFMAWLDEAILIPGYIPGGLGPISTWGHQWFYDGPEHVDPLKEAEAQEVRLKNNTTTLADEYAKRGQDWEEKLRQRAREKALMRELGLEVEPQPADPAMQAARMAYLEDDSDDS